MLGLTVSPIWLLDVFAWFWMGLGVVSGALLGLGFRHPAFLGGYDAWPRRLARLGHIAFFGTGLLCIAMAGTLSRHAIGEVWAARAAWLMVAGSIGMPLVCGLCVWKKALVAVFAGPVVCIGGAVCVVWVRMVVLQIGGAQ